MAKGKWDDVIEIGRGVDEVRALDELLPKYAGCNLTTVEVDRDGNEYLDVDHPKGKSKILIRRPK